MLTANNSDNIVLAVKTFNLSANLDLCFGFILLLGNHPNYLLLSKMPVVISQLSHFVKPQSALSRMCRLYEIKRLKCR